VLTYFENSFFVLKPPNANSFSTTMCVRDILHNGEQFKQKFRAESCPILCDLQSTCEVNHAVSESRLGGIKGIERSIQEGQLRRRIRSIVVERG
jgi:hypothetical protein